MVSLLEFMWEMENTPAFASLLVASALLILSIFIASLVFHLKDCKRWVLRNKSLVLALLIIFILGLVIRIYLFPLHFPNDGGSFFYVSAAKNIADYGEYQECNYSSYCMPPKKPYLTYPLITGLAFSVTGTSIDIAAWINIVISGLSVVAMYFVTEKLLKNQRAAFLSSLLLSVMINHIYYSNTTESHPTSIFFLLMSVIGFQMFIEKKDFISHFLFLSSAALCISTRLDHWGFVPLFLIWYIIERKKISRINFRVNTLPLLVVGILLIPCALMIYPFAFHNGSDASDFGLEYSSQNIDVVVQSMTKVPFMGLWFIHIVGLFGAALGVKRGNLLLASLAVPGLVYLLMFSIYEYTSIVNMRYLLPGGILSIILAAYVYIKPTQKIQAVRVVFPVMLFSMFLVPLLFWTETESVYSSSRYPLYEFTSENAKLMEECMMLQCEGRVSWALLQTRIYPFSWYSEMADNPEYVISMSEGDCIRYLEASSCFRHIPGVQEAMHENFDLTLLKERVYEERGETIRLYDVNAEKE